MVGCPRDDIGRSTALPAVAASTLAVVPQTMSISDSPSGQSRSLARLLKLQVAKAKSQTRRPTPGWGAIPHGRHGVNRRRPLMTPGPESSSGWGQQLGLAVGDLLAQRSQIQPAGPGFGEHLALFFFHMVLDVLR